MNHQSTVSHKDCYRQARKKKTRHFVSDVTRMAMIIVPIVLFTIVLTLAFNSNGTEELPKLDTVQENGYVINQSDYNGVFSVTNLPYIYETSAKTDEETEKTEHQYTDREVELISKTVYGEALVTNSDMEMAAVAWCILNRVDSPYYPDTIEDVVTQKRQFHGYNEGHPVTDRIENLVRDVLDRWYAEKDGEKNIGRVLPKDYIYFEGDGRHNHYSTEWHGKEYWDWSLPNPYEN